MSGLLNHVWQSTAFAIVASVLAMALRGNRAAVRYWLWFSASLKFLAPFALLVSLGSHLGWVPSNRPAAATALPAAVAVINEPFHASVAAPAPSTATRDWASTFVFALWACGFAAMAYLRLRDWQHLRATVRNGIRDGEVQAGLPVVRCEVLEPGVVGIMRPLLLLPNGIEERLTPSQFRAVLAHESCHVRRRDNLRAAVHMIVEALFWFHPLVWWIGARLVEERERACDEAVVASGSKPADYAEAILTVCRFYLEAPLAYVSGVAGGDLQRRVHAILRNQTVRQLSRVRKAMLTAAAAAAVGIPVGIGVVNAPPSQAQTPAGLAFDVATIKPNHLGEVGGKMGQGGGGPLQFQTGRAVGRNVSARRMIQEAYHVSARQLTGGAGWVDSDHFEFEGKAAGAADEDQLRQMLQTFLSERFHLAVHHELKPMSIYQLTIGKNGPKLDEIKDGNIEPVPMADKPGYRLEAMHMVIRGSMQRFADALSGNPTVGRLVIDKTGLKGVYSFFLQWDPDDTLLNAVQRDLGLKLESQRADVDTVVIDHIEKPEAN